MFEMHNMKIESTEAFQPVFFNLHQLASLHTSYNTEIIPKKYMIRLSNQTIMSLINVKFS